MAENAAAPGGGQTKLVLIMIIGAVVLVLASTGGIFFLLKSMGMLNGGGHGGDNIPMDAPAIYHPLEPAFITNFKERGRTRYLQAEIQVMTRDPKVVEDLDKHMPVIRNNLLMLLGSQSAETLQSPEGREELRQKALEEVQKILKEETGKKGIEALYFTSFVMQ